MSGTELVYDPLLTFVDVFADSMLANHVAPSLTCFEVNVLAGLLEACGAREAAHWWLEEHQDDCDDPSVH